MAAQLPSLPAPHADFVAYLENNPDTPLRDLVRPYKEYESRLREIFAQQRDHSALQDPAINAVPVFAGKEASLKTRARNPSDDTDNDKYVMPLKPKDRRQHGTPAMAQSLKEFRDNFNLFSEQALSDMDWDNVVAAGSSVVTAMLPVPEANRGSKRALREYYHQKLAPSSDVDLFLVGLDEEGAKKKIADIEACIRNSVLAETTTIRTKNAITIASQYPTRHIQIVLRLYKSVSEILTGFDIDSSCYAYDGKQVWATPRGITAFCSQINEVDLTRRSPSYETRLAKYAHRGFEVFFPELDRTRIDPTLFERSFVRTLGLARLLLLERLPTENDREAYLNQRRVERGRPELDFWARKANRGLLPGNKKDEDPEDIPDWEFDDAVANYHTFTVPYGPKYHAKKIERLLFTKDMLLNAEWNRNKDRKVNLHRHPCFLGDVRNILDDCCGECPKPTNDDEEQVAEEESKIYVSGKISFLKDDPGRQQIGSFNPLTEHDWTDMAYLGNTQILCEAIIDGDIDSVRTWLEQEGNDINHRDHSGRMPLHFAIICGQLEIVKALVEAGARITSRVADGFTALHMAAAVGRADILKVIGEKSEANEAMEADKEDIRKANRSKDSDLEMVDVAEEAQKDEDSNDADVKEGESDESDEEDSESYDHSGDENDDEDAVTDGSFVKVKSEDGNKDEAFDDPFGPDFFDFNVLAWDSPLSALHVAILAGNIECIETLVSLFGADALLPVKLKASPFNNATNVLLPLVLACKTAQPDTVPTIKKLIDLGSKPSQADTSMVSALHGSVLLGNVEAMKAMLSHDAASAKVAVNFLALTDYMFRPNLNSPLISAINTGKPEVVDAIMDAGAEPTVTFEDFVKAYIRCEDQAGTKFRSKDNDALRKMYSSLEQPVVIACNANMTPVVKRLIEAGANMNAHDDEGGRKLVNDHSYRGGCTLLDLVRHNIVQAEQRIQASNDQNNYLVANKSRRLLVPDDARIKRFEKGGYEESVAAQDFEFARIAGQRLERKHGEVNRLAYRDQSREDQYEQDTLILPELKDLEQWLLDRGAQVFDDLYPEHKQEDTNAGRQSYRNTQKKYNEDQGQYEFEHTFEDAGAPERKRKAYLRLFNAVWDGDEETVKALTLKPIDDGQGDPMPPVPITTKDCFGLTTLNIAVGRKHDHLAKLIIDIAQAQYQPKDDENRKKQQQRRRYKIRSTQDDGSDDEMEVDDPDAIPIMSEVVDDEFTIDDLGKLSETVGSQVPVDDFIYREGTMTLFMKHESDLDRDLGYIDIHAPTSKVGRQLTRAEWGHESLLDYAKEQNDLKLFKWVLHTTLEVSRMRPDLDVPRDWASDHIIKGHLHDAIRDGQTAFGEEIITSTGAMLPLDVLMSKVILPADQREKSRCYQGLMIYGKRKADWAKQASGDRRTETPKSLKYSPLLAEIAQPNTGNTSLRNVEFWLSDAALRLYNQFGKEHQDEKRVATLAQQAGSWEKVATDWFELRRHLALHLAVLNSNDEEDTAIFKYLLNVLPDTIDKKNLSGYSPLWLAFAAKNLEAARMLIEHGADQTTRDKLGNNIIHALLTENHPANRTGQNIEIDDAEYDQTDAMLQLVDKRLLETLFTERSSANCTGVTPFAIWIHKYRHDSSRRVDERLYDILAKYMPEDVYIMYDGSGQTPVHTLVMQDQHPMLRKIITDRPHLLGLENGTGQTAFELAQTRFIQKKGSDALPALNSNRHRRITRCRPAVKSQPVLNADETYAMLRDMVRGNPQIKRKVISVNDAREVSRRLAEKQKKDATERDEVASSHVRRRYRYGYDDEDNEDEDEVDAAFRGVTQGTYGIGPRKYGRRAPRKLLASKSAARP